MKCSRFSQEGSARLFKQLSKLKTGFLWPTNVDRFVCFKISAFRIQNIVYFVVNSFSGLAGYNLALSQVYYRFLHCRFNLHVHIIETY